MRSSAPSSLSSSPIGPGSSVQRSTKKVTEPRDGARFVLSSERMLPNSHNTPSSFSERARYDSIAFLIPDNFYPPKLRVILWPGRMGWAAMPETSVNKHDNFFARKNKIRFSGEEMPPSPPGNLVGPKNRDKPQFSVLVPSAANAGHYERALGLGKNISHVSYKTIFGSGCKFARTSSLRGPRLSRRGD